MRNNKLMRYLHIIYQFINSRKKKTNNTSDIY